jgi:hypothetical protein
MRWKKRVGLWALVLLTTLVAALYASVGYETFKKSKRDLGYLIDTRLDRVVYCAKGVDVLPGMPYLCKFFLTNGLFDSQEVEWMNRHGHFTVVQELKDAGLAKLTLQRLIDQGLDINSVVNLPVAGDRRWTALHVASFLPTLESLEWSQLLLEQGARTDLKDINGKSPLDLAEEALFRYPNDEAVQRMVEMLSASREQKTS